MFKPTLKLALMSAVTVALTAGTAMAGNGKDCTHKKSTEIKSETTSTATSTTAVLGASATAPNAKHKMKAYTVDEARALCTKHNAADIEACVARKTSKVKPKS